MGLEEKCDGHPVQPRVILVSATLPSDITDKLDTDTAGFKKIV